MSLIIITYNPTKLLLDIKKAIDSKTIETWSYDKDGDFTHKPEQWVNSAWMRPHIKSGELRFGFIGNTKITSTKLIYAVYHGRFAEMLLNHFDDQFSNVSATALPTDEDQITTRK